MSYPNQPFPNFIELPDPRDVEAGLPHVIEQHQAETALAVAVASSVLLRPGVSTHAEARRNGSSDPVYFRLNAQVDYFDRCARIIARNLVDVVDDNGSRQSRADVNAGVRSIIETTESTLRAYGLFALEAGTDE